jgi:AraC-like DNA-binding protein
MSATAIVSTAGFNGRRTPRHAAFQLLDGGLKRLNRFDNEVVDRNVPDAFRLKASLDHAKPLRTPALDRALPRVTIDPAASATRSGVSWPGMEAEIVQVATSERVEFRFKASDAHMLVLYERGVRRSGETKLDGLPSSSLHDLAHKLAFVPAGHEFVDVHESRVPARIVFFYFDEGDHANLIGGEPEGGQLSPRLFFQDAALLATAEKLMSAVEGDPEGDGSAYCQALGFVLAHELARSRSGGADKKPAIRGGLASWQQRTVASYIDEHLAESITLATLAELAGLSSYHFCRAFKQSFGVPPHRYHTRQRIEQAKIMLAKRIHSVTDIGLALGFSETSSFTAAFRKATGLTPTAYHRGLA